ncbi:hypothetical protein FRZ61_35080 [Hypericibacter adhaerens]|uniref:Uncharacterized protein n=1 Tax=Hypericibacter adhaerens TaxID=2602016 RepID=A0A5J6N4W5_9PROT|nr:hypothetical protein [Hypericibacter adhaerens]QEX23570.1 hypothetical protein FRZ61_35080 [Hypericibacter adhaerens]
MNLPPVTPATPAAGASPARPVQMAVAGTGQNNLAMLGQLGAGDILAGTVLERAADGTLTVRTDRGVLALSGGFEAAVGAKIMLEVRSAGARMQVVLLSVDGEPVDNQSPAGPKVGLLTLLDAGKGAVAQAADSAAAARTGPPAPSLPPVPTPPLADAAGIVGAKVIATLLRPNDLRSSAPPSLPNAPAAQPPVPGQRLPYHLAAILPPAPQAVSAVVDEAPREVFIATVRQQTPEGELVLESPLGTLRIPRPPEATVAPPAGPPAPAKTPEAGPAPAGTGKLTAPSTLSTPTALAGAAAPAEAAPDQAHSWPAGTRLVLTLPTPSPNGETVSAGPRLLATMLRPAEPQALPPATARAAATPAPQAPATPAAPVAAGQKLPLELVSVLPPIASGANNPASAQNLGASQPAILTSLRPPLPNGQAILEMPEGLVALDRAIGAPAGTRLLLLPTPAAPPPLVNQSGPGQIFNAVLETLALLDSEKAALPLPATSPSPSSAAPAGNGAAADQPATGGVPLPVQTDDLLAQNLPRVGPHLAAGLATFIRARLADKPVAWPGSELRQALQSAGRPELVAKLEQGFAELARAAPAASQDGQWKTIVLPLLDEQALHQARLAIRRDPGERNQPKDGKPASVHFLLDIELSRMGAMQLDGLVRGKRFDLMLRTHKPLDSQMQGEIQRLFAEAKSVTGITGEIYFQVAAMFASPGAAAPAASQAGGLIA